MAEFLNEPHFIIGMEIVFDSKLEEALDACSIFDGSSARGSGYTLDPHHGSGDELESGNTLNNSSGDVDDDGSTSSDDSSAGSDDQDEGAGIKQGPGDEVDDELMARLAGAYIDTDSEEEDDDDDEEGSDEDSSDSDDDSNWNDHEMQSHQLLGDRSLNTNIAVMLDTSHGGSGSTHGQLSLSSRGLSTDRRERRRRSLGGGTGRSRRHKGMRSRSRTNSPGPSYCREDQRGMKDLKNEGAGTTLTTTLTTKKSQLEGQLQMQVTANPIA